MITGRHEVPVSAWHDPCPLALFREIIYLPFQISFRLMYSLFLDLSRMDYSILGYVTFDV